MLDLIIEKLAENFPDYYIFNEKITQNCDNNSIIVWQNKGKLEKKLKNRYLSTTEFSIFYYSSENVEKIAENLCEVLSDLGDFKSTSLSYEIIENTLEIVVSYQFFVLKEQNSAQSMQKYGLQFEL